MRGPWTDGRGRGSGLSRGGGSSRGRGRGANAPPRQWVPVSAGPLEQSPSTLATAPSHEMEQNLTLQASSSTVVPAVVPPQTQLQQPAVRAEQPLLRGGGSSRGRGRGANAPPRQWVPVSAAPLDRAIAPQLQVPAVVAVNPPQTLLPSASTENSSRPGFGTEGQETIVNANYLLASVDERVLHHYDVAISPAVTSKNICRLIMNELVENFHDSCLGKRVLAYDGRKNIYTAGPLPFISKKFGVMVDVEESGFEREFIVTIRCVSKVHHHWELGNPNENIQFLNVVLREKASNSHQAVGRSFFHPDFGKEELGNGLEYWNGFYQSLRTTEIGLSLNIDMTATAFFEPILVTEFVSKYLNMTDHIKLNSALKGVKVETNHLGFIRHYKISRVSTVATERLMFSEVKSGRPVLQYRHLLAVQTDSRTGPVYLPMELCTIVAGQRYSKKLNHRQATHLLQATGKRPKQREKVIKEMVEQNDYNRDELVHTELVFKLFLN